MKRGWVLMRMGEGEELNRMNTVCFDTVYACHLFSYLPSHYITMTQFQYILMIFFIAWRFATN